MSLKVCQQDRRCYIKRRHLKAAYVGLCVYLGVRVVGGETVVCHSVGILKPITWLCKRKFSLTLSLLMLHICGVSKTFGDWYQKTNKTEDTNKLTLLAFKIITILHNTRLASFIKHLETVSKGLLGIDRRTSVTQRVTAVILWHSCVQTLC
jgi:hypothetical protein